MTGKKLLITTVLAALFSMNLAAAGGSDETGPEPVRKNEALEMKGEMASAVFAGGCFWGVEAVFERLEGVGNVMSGYSGGDAATAHYKLVSTGQTEHAEAVYLEYDPSVISFSQLLEVFFIVAHDPTQYNYQGPDIGPQYRSAVFYADENQKMETEDYIEKLGRSGYYGQPIVTEITALEAFYPAEEYHQNFMELNPNHPYIVYWDVPKIRDLEEKYPALLSEKYIDGKE